jgi:hypothetical protein
MYCDSGSTDGDGALTAAEACSLAAAAKLLALTHISGIVRTRIVSPRRRRFFENADDDNSDRIVV